MKKLLSRKKKKKGFTLIELVIVLGVMAIIAAIAIPSLKGTKDNARIRADEESCKTIERSIKTLIADETIPEEATGDIIIKFTNNNMETDIKDLTITGINDKDKNKIKDSINRALGDIKKPQRKEKDGYKIELYGDGKAKAKVTPEDK